MALNEGGSAERAYPKHSAYYNYSVVWIEHNLVWELFGTMFVAVEAAQSKSTTGEFVELFHSELACVIDRVYITVVDADCGRVYPDYRALGDYGTHAVIGD